jgi:hypothetical protein
MKPSGPLEETDDGRNRKVRSMQKFVSVGSLLECVRISVSACAGALSPMPWAI